MIPRSLNLSVLLLGGQHAAHIDTSGRQTLEVWVVDLGLCHEAGRGADDVVAVTVASAERLGVDGFFAEAGGLFASGAEGDNLEAHVGFVVAVRS